MTLLATWVVDWSEASKLLLAAVLGAGFAALLQWWLLCRQERFQKKMLDRQLEFLERLERERSERDAKADARKSASAALARRIKPARAELKRTAEICLI